MEASSCAESVLRLPKLTNFSMVAWMRVAEISFNIAAICRSASPNWLFEAASLRDGRDGRLASAGARPCAKPLEMNKNKNAETTKNAERRNKVNMDHVPCKAGFSGQS